MLYLSPDRNNPLLVVARFGIARSGFSDPDRV